MRVSARLGVMLYAIVISNVVWAGWGLTQETIADNRTWLYTPNSPVEGNSKILNGKRALVVTLHGCAQHATELKGFGNWEPTAEEYGVVVAIPDVDKGVIFGCWDYDEARNRSGHIQDILNLVENLKARQELQIDPQQVYITGLSSGAAFALELACQAPHVLAGVGAVAGPSVGSDQQRATGSTPSNNVSQATSKCTQLAGSKADFLNTQIASVAYGDLDKKGGGKLPIPPPLQGATPLIDVQWTKDNAQIFTNLFHSPHLGDTTHTIQEGKGQEQVSTLGGKEVVSLVKMFGVGHAWPAGSDDTSFGGGNFIHKVGLNYPAYVTQWFFENNRRLSARPGVSKVSIDIQLRDTRNRIERQGKPAPTRHD